ncbi:bifunctional 5,10-methylenetetrahydrofolate dehydrogenase/5,10-methenyltetrahydrofolate cyclohydrolase [Candidatus Mycoplasma pogonae]
MIDNSLPLILDGKKVAEAISKKLAKQIQSLPFKIHFTIVQVGDLFASNKYIANKLKKAQSLGIIARLIKFPATINEAELLTQITALAPTTDAIIVQLPLPNHIHTQTILNAIPAQKDVDGLSQINTDLFYNEQPSFAPATALGIIMLLEFYNIKLENQKTYVIGESNLVGKPIKKLLEQKGGISKSFNINTGIASSEEADILVVAAGSQNLVKKNNVKQGVVVIDVGINTLGNNKITGDVDFNDVVTIVSAISPVPGGVGPMTIIALMHNIVKAAIQQKQNKKIVKN